MKVWALFVKFKGGAAEFLPDGWVFQGMVTDAQTLNRTVDAIRQEISITRGMDNRTVAYKVVELS